jgi:tRNA (cytidine/uridine-2'-O-)-methyltransferase
MRRAGLDYREYADVRVYTELADFMQRNDRPRLYGVTTRATRSYHQVEFRPGDALLFGPETRGLPADLLERLGEAATIRIPMLAHSRSLNLSNAAALVAYEALRQLDFPGLG